jgi:hypothetical protein
MVRKIVWSFVGLLVLVVAAGAAYLYYYPVTPTQNTPAPAPVVQQAQPDHSIIAGPVTALTSKSISIKTQDGSTVTLGVASTTQVSMAGPGGQPTPKTIGDVRTGTIVLVTPSRNDAAVAQLIVLLPVPSAH